MAGTPPHGHAAIELGRLLRSCRQRLRPQDVGLPAGARRRTPGLRREEVALLANVSTTYYTFLEQGRDVRPSPQVVDALAAALRLRPTEHTLLRQLARGGEAPTGSGVETLAAEVAALVDRMEPYPTYVTGCRFDVLAANASARELFTDWPSLPAEERNIVWFMFADPRSRVVYVEWEQEAAAQLGRFRAAAARHAGDPWFVEFVTRLHAASPQAREWWRGQEVQPLRNGTKRLRHARLGELLVHNVVLQVAEAPEQKLVTFASAVPGDDRVAHLLDVVD